MTDDSALTVAVTVIAAPPLVTFRCPRCKTLLAELRLPPGAWVRIKCSKCNQVAVKERPASSHQTRSLSAL